MVFSRRSFMAGATALGLAPKLAFANAAEQLIASESSHQIAPEAYPATSVWCFNDSIPGSLIKVKQGQKIEREFVNRLPQDSSVHWHGIRLNNAMDGVPGVTQDVVKPGGSFDYHFTAPDAGTYWYHSHNRSLEQVERGLYGPIIVEEHELPDVDRDEVIVLDDWLFTEQAQIHGDFNAMHSLSHGGRLGNYLTAMTLAREPLTVKQNERIRLRFINVATDKIFSIGLHGFEGKVVALDGMPLVEPIPLDHLVLGPAQRADVIADVTTEDGGLATIVSHERSSAIVLAEVTVSGKASRAKRDEMKALPLNHVESPGDLMKAKRAPLLMEGGAMGRLRAGIYKGEELSIRDLVRNGQVWTFNGVANITDEPLAELNLGEDLVIPITNQTAFPHAMHLHGHHFQEVLADGSLGPFRDTLLVNRNETREIAFKATNPGSWLFHCHMLSHQKAGMKTFVRVS